MSGNMQYSLKKLLFTLGSLILMLIVIKMCFFRYDQTAANFPSSLLKTSNRYEQSKSSSFMKNLSENYTLELQLSPTAPPIHMVEVTSAPGSNVIRSSLTDVSKTEYQLPIAKKLVNLGAHVKKTQDILHFVDKQCRKYNKKNGVLIKPRMLLIPKNWDNYNIMYAANPKTGSTSFKKWLHKIQGDQRDINEIRHVHGNQNQYGSLSQAWDFYENFSDHPFSDVEFIKHFYTVVFMRNPLTRLLSAFRDKILRHEQSTSEAVVQVLKGVNPMITASSSDIEKFAAFAEIIANGHTENVHFVPQWEHVRICDFPYDMIAQTETTNEQIQIIQEHTNTTHFPFPSSRLEEGIDSPQSNTLSLTHHFYDGIRSSVMKKIYQYYKWDFVLAGFSKLNNPNFPFLDFDQNFDEEFDDIVKD